MLPRAKKVYGGGSERTVDNATSVVDDLVALALQGLPSMYLPTSRQFVQTVRGVRSSEGPHLAPEGTSLRYAAIVTLGLSRCAESSQREVLAGATAAELTAALSERASTSSDPGAVALTAWAVAETELGYDASLFDLMRGHLNSGQALPTVAVAWMLTAAVAAGFFGPSDDVATRARDLLLTHQGQQGLFPHALPPGAVGRIRAHVGCFADEVYPIQALARFGAATADSTSLAAANRCAARITALQGPAGQWWWHYDSRRGSVVEGFPVYSVHQHAMAPMALMDLADAGGDDHAAAIYRGLDWLTTHPEVFDELVDERLGVVWRKVGRREPAKLVRKLNAATTSLRPGLTVPTDRLFPATVVDHECRPYELGWLLYAWKRPTPARPGAEDGEVQHG